MNVQKFQMNLDDVYREQNFICVECNKPYQYPMIDSQSGKIACKTCWGSDDLNVNLCRSLWYHRPIADRMEQIRIRLDHHNQAHEFSSTQKTLKPEHRLDCENEQTLQHVKNGDWEKVMEDMRKTPIRIWNNMSRYILVEACEHSDCPREVIIALLDSGIGYFNTRPCINDGGIGAMNVCAVAAEKGTLEALYVFVERKIYWCFSPLFPISIAAEHGQADVLDFLWSVDYPGCYGKETIKEHTNLSMTMQFAEEKGMLEKIMPVIEKHFPGVVE